MVAKIVNPLSKCRLEFVVAKPVFDGVKVACDDAERKME